MGSKKQYDFVLPKGFVLQGGKREYEVVEVLGKGGFGVTYKVIGEVKDDNIGVDVPFAIKEYFPDICSREADNATIKIPETKQKEVKNGLTDFLNEAHRLQEACKLNDNIVNVNEVFEANGTAYYVLEYLGGGDLRKLVKESPDNALTEEQMLALMLPVGKAIQSLHNNHILHLDIKPDNIVIRKGRKGAPDEPVLIDFGLATHFNKSGAPTSMMPSMGITPGYSPIEQYSEQRRFEPKLDVYAFSATCLYLLTGKDPVEALSMPAVFDDSMIPDHVSDKVRQAIKHGLSKEQDYRTPSIKQLLVEMLGDTETGLDTIHMPFVATLKTTKENKTKIQSKKAADNSEIKKEKSGFPFWKSRNLLILTSIALFFLGWLAFAIIHIFGLNEFTNYLMMNILLFAILATLFIIVPFCLSLVAIKKGYDLLSLFNSRLFFLTALFVISGVILYIGGNVREHFEEHEIPLSNMRFLVAWGLLIIAGLCILATILYFRGYNLLALIKSKFFVVSSSVVLLLFMGLFVFLVVRSLNDYKISEEHHSLLLQRELEREMMESEQVESEQVAAEEAVCQETPAEDSEYIDSVSYEM